MDSNIDNSRVLNKVTVFVATPIWVTAFGDLSLIYEDWSDFNSFDNQDGYTMENRIQRVAA